MTSAGIISDLATPRLPWLLRTFNASLAPFTQRAMAIEPDALMESAVKQTKLTDFGDSRFEEPLRIIAHSRQREAELHPLGQLQLRVQIAKLLSTRLRFVELWKRHPEIHARPCERPIFIVGMPRTGTTFLQRLLARDPGLRHLPLWESMSPLPKGGLGSTTRATDPRIGDAKTALKIIYYAAPRMVAMHEMEATEPDEEIWLMAVDFATMFFEVGAYAPSYGEWYASTDQTWAYTSLRSMLKALDRYHPGERWLLKSPQHLSKLGSLLATFPDATIVQTHRDPVTVVSSFANMVSYSARINTWRPDPPKLARYWEKRIESMLRSSIADRPRADPRFVDVHFVDLMRDPIEEVKKIYRIAGRELTTAAETAMKAYLVSNPRGKHGAHRYRLADLGLEEAELRERFAFYQETFTVQTEGAKDEPPAVPPIS